MKVKVLHRVEEDFTRERAQDLRKVHHNLDPVLHPFEKAKEYARALNAAKLDRVFAHPFVAALAHDDGVTCMARSPKVINSLLAGAADGEIRLWDLPARRVLRRLVGHTAAVRGVSYSPDGASCVSCSTDATVKLWRVPYAPLEAGNVAVDVAPTLEFQGKGAFRGIDHHWGRNSFATCGAQVDIWDHERSEPVSTFSWGADSVTSVRFNPVEPDIFATTGSDRSIALYDLRSFTPIRKLIMQTRCNALAWNPMEAFNFVVANEDCALYTYDMRRLKQAAYVHKDFVSAVMDVDFSPTGREFVAGSYDRSVRIFASNMTKSREVYTTKRMQRVFTVRYSGDATYVFSGSDDMNVRIWKAEASQQLGTTLPREEKKQAYQQALVQRFGHMPEIKRIIKHRHLPTAIYKSTKLRRTITDAENRKTQRRVQHSAPGSVVVKPPRKRKIVAEVE